MKQRIVSEQNDQTARIKELEEHVALLEYELACARGVHPKALGPMHAEGGRSHGSGSASSVSDASCESRQTSVRSLG